MNNSKTATSQYLAMIQQDSYWQEFWQTEQPLLVVTPTGQLTRQAPSEVAYLSGSFNPLHIGHQRLAQVASQILKCPVYFELSITNVDKPPLSPEALLIRLAQFQNYQTLVVTKAVTFLAKAKLLPNSTFIMGYDTAARLVAPKYYQTEAFMRQSLQELQALGSHFLVACRYQDNQLKTLADISIDPEFQAMFQAISPQLFCENISSTQLRTLLNPQS